MANRGRSGAASLAAILLAAFASGCATSAPARLDLQTPGGTVASTANARPSVDTLAVCIAPFTRETAGVVGGRKMLVTELDQRLADALRAQSDRDVRFVVKVATTMEEYAAEEAPVKMAIEKAYLHGVYESKSAVVVLRIEHAGKSEHFRGQDTGLNWLNSSDEMAAALGKAMTKALVQARPRLTAIAAGL